MEQKELTSVDHIENAIQKYMAYYEGDYKAELFTIIELNEAVKEAKEMHKQQIEKAFNVGCNRGVDIGQNWDYHEGQNQGHQYYEQEYGKTHQSI